MSIVLVQFDVMVTGLSPTLIFVNQMRGWRRVKQLCFYDRPFVNLADFGDL